MKIVVPWSVIIIPEVFDKWLNSWMDNWFEHEWELIFFPLWKRWATITFSFSFLFSFWFFFFVLLFQIYLWCWLKQIFKVLIVLIDLNRKKIRNAILMWKCGFSELHLPVNCLRCMLALAIEKILLPFTQQIFIFVQGTV